MILNPEFRVFQKSFISSTELLLDSVTGRIFTEEEAHLSSSCRCFSSCSFWIRARRRRSASSLDASSASVVPPTLRPVGVLGDSEWRKRRDAAVKSKLTFQRNILAMKEKQKKKILSSNKVCSSVFNEYPKYFIVIP